MMSLMRHILTLLAVLLLAPLSALHAVEPPMLWGDSTRLGRPFAKDPSVIHFGGRYLLYYSIPPWAKELAPPDAPRGWAIGIAESRDLVNWKRIGEILPGQECDKNGLAAPGAIVLDGKVHLFTRPMATARATRSATLCPKMACDSCATRAIPCSGRQAHGRRAGRLTRKRSSSATDCCFTSPRVTRR